LLHRLKAVVKRNLPACKKALKIELGDPREKRSLAQSQPLPLEQSQREFSLLLGLSQFGRLKKLVQQRKRHSGNLIRFYSLWRPIANRIRIAPQSNIAATKSPAGLASKQLY